MLARFFHTALAVTLAAACGGITATGAQTLKKMTLVQMHPIMGVGEEVFLYAVPKRLGYFAKEGLDVDIQNTQNGMVSSQLMLSNGAQVGTTAADAIMSVREQGGDLVSFFGLKRNPGSFMIVLPNSPIHTLQDLKGKTVGAPSFGAGSGLALKQNLNELGITPDQYTAINTGAGPSAIAALRSGKIDALTLWDAALGAAENNGLTARIVSIPFLDSIAGTTLATSTAFASANPKEVEGYCRAMTKALLFTMTNRVAAIHMLWDEFPATKQTDVDEATAVKNGVHIMDRFLEMALQGLPAESRFGDFLPANWENTHSAYVKLGTLKGKEGATAAYTSKFLPACNDFDRGAIVAQAKAMEH